MIPKHSFPARKRFFRTFLVICAFCALWVARLLPRRAGLALFGFAGRAAFFIPTTDKNRTFEHLRMIYNGIWDEKTIRRTARAVYCSLGKNLFDAIKLTQYSGELDPSAVLCDNPAEIENVLRKGKGVVAISAHIGCFEILHHFFARRGFKVMAVGRHLFDERLNRIMCKIRGGINVTYLDRDENPLQIVRGLKQGKLFGVLIDQDTRVDGIFAPFLGKPAFTPLAPVKIAMKFHIPVFVVTTARQSGDTHRIFVSPQVFLDDTGDFKKDLMTNVTRINDLICSTILKFPEQWVWMHRRWKKQPPEQGAAPSFKVSV